jgi:topoisomerase-4 subunit A
MLESGKKALIISEAEGSSVEAASNVPNPEAEIIFGKNDGVQPRNKKINLAEFIDVKGVKAKGNKLTDYKVKEVNILAPDVEDVLAEAEEAPVAQAESSKGGRQKEEPAAEKKKSGAVVKGKKDSGPRVVEFEIVPKGKGTVKEFAPEKKKGKAEKKPKEKTKKKGKGGKNQMKLF